MQVKDIKYFQNLGDNEIFLWFDDCVPYSNSEKNVEFIICLLKILNEKSIVDDHIHYRIDKELSLELGRKFKEHYDDILDKDEYINKATKEMKTDRGYAMDDLETAGSPTSTIKLTVIEVIMLHHILVFYEDRYDKFKENIRSIPRSRFPEEPSAYFKYLFSFKNYLESRLGNRIISDHRYAKK